MWPGHEVKGYVMTGYMGQNRWLHKQIYISTNKHGLILHNNKD